MVVALNDEQEAIAQSNEVTVTITGGVTIGVQIPMRMPLVIRD
jgi:hypothetical protein